MKKDEKDEQGEGEIKTMEDVRRSIKEIHEKIDKCRYRINVLQEVFVNHPEAIDDGPEDLTLFYMSIKAVLDDIMETGTDANDDLRELLFSKVLKNAEVS